ncbi:MAG: hypothetical protein NZ533_12640, partial [Casimicrobiaceae bacterium]|nr:hypothetical protein [Casimicrobiaceae bacterium]
CEQRRAYTDDPDIWLGLRALWHILRDEKAANRLGIAPLNGKLFEPLTLDRAEVRNRDFLSAFWHLSLFNDAVPRRINYAALDTEELGSVYESLLDYEPQVNGPEAQPRFVLSEGSERRTTGSYYTPPTLVAELVQRVVGDGWRMASSEWQVASSGWRVASSEWRMAS